MGSPRPLRPTQREGAPRATATGLRPVDGAYFEEVAIGSIAPNPRQPRLTFDEEALEELAASISEVGLLQPVVVRKLGPGRYELVMGERRMRASQRAGLEYIPAIVRETSDNDMLRDALIENLHRAQLDPLEEAAAYKQLLDDFGATHEQLAQRIGRSRPHISNTLRLLGLPPGVQKRVAAGVISAGHARALLGSTRPLAQERLAQRIVSEGLSVRTVEEIVSLGGDDGPARSPADRPRRSRSPRPCATCPTGCRICSRLGSRSRWAPRRARSPSSSPRSTTWSGSSRRCPRKPAPAGVTALLATGLEAGEPQPGCLRLRRREPLKATVELVTRRQNGSSDGVRRSSILALACLASRSSVIRWSDASTVCSLTQ